ncbi:monooxygenase FAD-binding [Methylocella silvestris BL2]|uniref:Monooxygenase FAD-binding n=1 Tax=Methylocella silvestris (strain DSM 15510 / CIP 108128 / LMG 27833 / NCIMB 13906 / BL2) TaxID=395965 RepID=B8ERE7_METSB|nr:FAD-dependent oxidoreductase [Methylocella silvestris]ACK50331.1 monooxygenase FAD-binding [Methylocella silvestris BL2]
MEHREDNVSPRGGAHDLSCRCCVVGGGPAGMMLGLLLARAGIDVIVLEKHADFLRDFRGDTIHPSTLEALHDLGFLDEFLRLPHQEARELAAVIGDTRIPLADFSHLPTQAKFIAFMPQWDFLNFLARKAADYPTFRLLMSTEAVGLVTEGGRIAGVRAKTKDDGAFTIRADLTFGADGRHSLVRAEAGFAPIEIGAPMDVLWFKLSRRADDPNETFGRLESGQMLVLINRGEHWQCGYVIAKGSADALKAEGIEALRARIRALAPFMSDRLAELASVDDAKLLSVAIDRLPLWHRPGLLCIGDCAHAMSPVGGVGINLAIQDAIAAANLLSVPLLSQPRPPDECLARVQARREFPAKVTQEMQAFIQTRVISQVLSGKKLTPPLFLRLFTIWPPLRRLPARLIGLGVRPERVRSPRA